MILLSCLFAVPLCGCGSKIVPKKEDDYLYSFTLKDYEEHLFPDTSGGIFTGGCSSIRNGNLYGRNLDLTYCDSPEFVIRVKAAPGRFSSIGLCADPVITSDVSEMTQKELLSMPNITNDGINENGVIISCNVVDTTGVDDMTGTAPGKPAVHAAHVVRYLLDRAASAENAVELLKDIDIQGGFSGYGLHWMIADENDTFTAEIINNSLVVTKNSDFCMTNFYLHYGPRVKEQEIAGSIFYDFPLLTDYSIGVERYQILKDLYSGACSTEGMKAALMSTACANEYDTETSPAWYSELCGGELTIKSPADELSRALDYQRELYYERDRKAPNGSWITWHSSIYNIKERTLTLFSQENWDKEHCFSLYE